MVVQQIKMQYGQFNDSCFFHSDPGCAHSQRPLAMRKNKKNEERLNKMEMNNNRISFWLLYY